MLMAAIAAQRSEASCTTTATRGAQHRLTACPWPYLVTVLLAVAAAAVVEEEEEVV
jgi:hypothetical protein